MGSVSRRWRFRRFAGGVTPPPTPATVFYVATDGTPEGDGSEANPWDRDTALAEPAAMTAAIAAWADDTGPAVEVECAGGTYRGDCVCSIESPSSTKRVLIRPKAGERVRWDGDFDYVGSYTTIHGVEFLYRDPVRWTATIGSAPADLPRLGKGISFASPGSYNRLSWCDVHDLADGIGGTRPGWEVVGGRTFNHGWTSHDRGHGMGMYFQHYHITDTAKVTNVACFNNFGGGLRTAGTSDSGTFNVEVTGLASWDTGGPLSIGEFDPIATAAGSPPPEGKTYDWGYTWNSHQTATAHFGGSFYRWCSLRAPTAAARTLLLGESGLPTDGPIEVTNSIMQGRVEMNEWAAGTIFQDNKVYAGAPAIPGGEALLLWRHPTGRLASDVTVEGNHYRTGGSLSSYGALNARIGGSATAYNTIAGWTAATGWDVTGSLSTGTFSGADVIVRADPYLDGYGIVHCWNWLAVSSLNVDLSPILSIGDEYAVHHAYDIHGDPIVSGTYDGGLVALPQEAAALPDPPVPYGMTGPIPTSAPYFNVFLVRPLTGSEVGAVLPETPPVIAFTLSQDNGVVTVTDTSYAPDFEVGFSVRKVIWPDASETDLEADGDINAEEATASKSLANGTYDVTVTGTDGNGNTRSLPKQITVTTPPNLLSALQATFESGAAGTGWGNYNSSGGGFSTTRPRSGTRGYRITNPHATVADRGISLGAGGADAHPIAQASVPYSFGIYVSKDVGSVTTFGIQFVWYNSSNASVGASAVYETALAGDTSFVRAVAENIMAPATAVKVRVLAYMKAAAQNDAVYVDDASLQQASALTDWEPPA